MSLWCSNLLEEAAAEGEQRLDNAQSSVQRHAPELRPVHLRKLVDHVSTPLKLYCLRDASRDQIHRSARMWHPIGCIETSNRNSMPTPIHRSSIVHHSSLSVTSDLSTIKHILISTTMGRGQMELAGIGAAEIERREHAG